MDAPSMGMKLKHQGARGDLSTLDWELFWSNKAGIMLGSHFLPLKVSILIARIWNVYPCAALVNRFRPQSKHIRKNQQHALWFSGLRGAMAFALARQSVMDLPSGHGHVLLTATLLTIFFTVLFIGGFTSYALKFLKIACHGPGHEDTEADEELNEASMEDVGISQIMVTKSRPTTLSKQKDKISEKLKQLKNDTSFTTLDTKYLKPFLQAVPSGEGSELKGVSHIPTQMLHGVQGDNNQFKKAKNNVSSNYDIEDIDEDELSESRGLLMSSKT
ncbi:hypothetical protein L7F22_058061 [Adiantum nelumboides]|nr:hypothetical protein [Adiantum nelumboides]